MFFFFKDMNKSEPSSLWWPEHCKDESKMNLHQQQADVFHILKGLFFPFSVLIKIVYIYIYILVLTVAI